MKPTLAILSTILAAVWYCTDQYSAAVGSITLAFCAAALEAIELARAQE